MAAEVGEAEGDFAFWQGGEGVEEVVLAGGEFDGEFLSAAEAVNVRGF